MILKPTILPTCSLCALGMRHQCPNDNLSAILSSAVRMSRAVLSQHLLTDDMLVAGCRFMCLRTPSITTSLSAAEGVPRPDLSTASACGRWWMVSSRATTPPFSPTVKLEAGKRAALSRLQTLQMSAAERPFFSVTCSCPCGRACSHSMLQNVPQLSCVHV